MVNVTVLQFIVIEKHVFNQINVDKSIKTYKNL